MLERAITTSARPCLASLVLLMCFACAACGDDAASIPTAGPTGQQEGPDAGADAEDSDLPDPEEPPVPVFIDVDVATPRALYVVGQRVEPTAEVYDQFGALMEDAPVEFTLTPDGSTTLLEDGRYSLDVEGEIILQGCVVSVPDLCAQRLFVVDDASPTVMINSPAPGAFLLAEEHELITVEGQVVDTHAADFATFVNGRRIDVADDGTFSYEVEPSLGINHIQVSVSDGLHAPWTSAVDVLWAGAYLPRTEAGFELQDAATVRLGQSLFDDRRPAQIDEATSELVAGDLADIFTYIAGSLDLAPYIPDPIVSSSALTLRVSSVQMGQVEVDFTLTDTGVDLFLRVQNLRADTTGSVSVSEGGAVPLDGYVQASIAGFVKLNINDSDASLQATVDQLTVAIEDASGHFVEERANAVFAIAAGALRVTLEDFLVDLLRDSFIDQIPGVLDGVFSSIQGAIDGQTLPLDLGLGDPVTLNLDAAFSHVGIAGGDEVRATMDVTVSTDATEAVHPEAPGVPALGSDTLAPLIASSDFQVAIRTALLNGILFEIWQTGLLDLDLTALLPAEISGLLTQGSVRARLPPVVTEAPAETGRDLRLQLGQLEIETALVFGTVDVYGISAWAYADLALIDGVLTIEVDPQVNYDTWTISSTSDSPLFDRATLADLLDQQLWPLLGPLLEEKIEIALPSLGLDSLSSFAPAAAGLTVDFVQARDLSMQEDYVLMLGGVEMRTPAVR